MYARPLRRGSWAETRTRTHCLVRIPYYHIRGYCLSAPWGTPYSVVRTSRVLKACYPQWSCARVAESLERCLFRCSHLRAGVWLRTVGLWSVACNVRAVPSGPHGSLLGSSVGLCERSEYVRILTLPHFNVIMYSAPCWSWSHSFHHAFPWTLFQRSFWEGLSAICPLVLVIDADYLFPFFFPSMMVLDVGMSSPPLSISSSNFRFLKICYVRIGWVHSGVPSGFLSTLVSKYSANVLWFQSWMSCTLCNKMVHSGSSSPFLQSVSHILAWQNLT